jgi:hypothetical protein
VLGPAPTPAPARYNLVANQRLIYVDQGGTSHTVLPTAFGTAIQTSAVVSGMAQAVTLQPPTDGGATPLCSIPVGANMRRLFSLPRAPQRSTAPSRAPPPH